MIRLKNISKTYHASVVPVYALRGVDLEVEAGEFVAVMGPSGSGKSTLLHILGFLDRPDDGSYYLFDSEVSRLSDDKLAVLRNHVAGFVFQQFHLLRRVTAFENTELPLVYAGEKQTGEKVRAGLEAVGLAERFNHWPNQLSGGEQQRVAIARALVNNPAIIFADEPTGNLDTKSEEEIMRILEGLNRQGRTIIMVTHEREVAERAGRIVTMRDGKIISDEKKNREAHAAPVFNPLVRIPRPYTLEDDGGRLSPLGSRGSFSLDDIFSHRHSAFGRMEFAQHLRQSVRAILSNKVRSFLSMLGILFGVGAVIAMLALGEGAKASIQESLKSLGSNLLSVQAGSAKVHGVATATGAIARFTLADVKAIRDLKELVNSASAYVRGSAQIVYKNENWNTSLEGVDFDYGKMRDTIPEVGRWFSRQEIARRDKVAVIGTTVANKLFGKTNPVGETIKINRIYFKVIGIAPSKGFRGSRDADDAIYIPVTTAMYRVFGKDYLDSIFAEVKDAELVSQAEQEIKEVITKRHRLFEAEEDAFHIRNMGEIQEMLTSTTKTMSLLLGCIAAISLVVGGIGIMNIMLVSVTERTREIGLRKAIGACRGDIMSQFLIEAVVMTFIGGLMGIILGSATAFVLSAVAGWATKVSWMSIVLSTTFSIAVGIGFGLWPARKAAELNPIEALRYE